MLNTQQHRLYSWSHARSWPEKAEFSALGSQENLTSGRTNKKTNGTSRLVSSELRLGIVTDVARKMKKKKMTVV